MSRHGRVFLALPFLAACVIILVAGLAGQLGKGASSTDTPVHVTAVFFNGIDTGDYRQACSVWEAARKHMGRCESGLTVQMATSALYGEFGGYKVIGHSEKVWRTGKIWYATVKVVYTPTGGQKITAHLRKRPGGPWYVWYVI